MSDIGKSEKLIQMLVDTDDVGAWRDAFVLCKGLITEDEQEVFDTSGSLIAVTKNMENVKKALDYGRQMRKKIMVQLKAGHTEAEFLYWDLLLMASRFDFDSFCRYIEREREPSKKFYEPRRRQLYPLAMALQQLEDNELDLLAISMPPGTGKTGLAIFYICWTSGLHPELQSIIGSHNMDFLRGVYEECLRVMDTQGEYLWHEVFPTVGICGTNAKNLRIDLGKRKRFTTIQLSSIGSGNAGKIRATNLLYCDDLCQGIEQAMSAEQMQKLWQKYTVDLKQRMQGNRVRELHIQTRWSVNDVVGRLQELRGNDERAKFINIPAYDENGQSNFDYPYGLGFTTKMFNDLEAGLDDASFRALYLGEPIEREGQLYSPDELRRYYTLPEREPDAIIAVCDTKEQGSDYCAMPVAYKYGDEYYIDKWLCDNGKPNDIEERIINILTELDVSTIRFESNRGGTLFADNVQKGLLEKGSHCHVTTKWNQQNKETRILVASSWVKAHCLFKAESEYNGKGSEGKLDKEYRTAMSLLTGYTMSGKNSYDDVPDALADLENFVKTLGGSIVKVRKRTF